jgi:hypothetical protein
VFVVVLIVEYLVLPQIAGARKSLHLLADVNTGWLAAGLGLELAALIAYAQLTRAVMPKESGRSGCGRCSGSTCPPWP